MDRGSEYLLYKIVDNIVDDSFPIIERLDERIDDLEDNIFLNKGQVITEEILALKRTIILLAQGFDSTTAYFHEYNGTLFFFRKY